MILFPISFFLSTIWSGINIRFISKLFNLFKLIFRCPIVFRFFLSSSCGFLRKLKEFRNHWRNVGFGVFCLSQVSFTLNNIHLLWYGCLILSSSFGIWCYHADILNLRTAGWVLLLLSFFVFFCSIYSFLGLLFILDSFPFGSLFLSSSLFKFFLLFATVLLLAVEWLIWLHEALKLLLQMKKTNLVEF